MATAGVLIVSLVAFSCGGGYGNSGGPGSPTLSSVALNPTSVAAGSSSTGTVTLSGAAPTYGTIVDLASNASAASVPASVTVAAGSTTATFPVTTTAVTASTSATITASYAGASKTAMLTITPSGTPAGDYTLTVTGSSGNLTHSTALHVTVH